MGRVGVNQPQDAITLYPPMRVSTGVFLLQRGDNQAKLKVITSGQSTKQLRYELVFSCTVITVVQLQAHE